MSQSKAELLPCPFCGKHVRLFYYHGGSPKKRMVSCENDECFVNPQCTGSTQVEAVQRWNKRPPLESEREDELRARLTHAIAANETLRQQLADMRAALEQIADLDGYIREFERRQNGHEGT